MSAFTDAEKAQVRQYLGQPDLFRYKDVRLESAFDAQSAEAIALTRSDLATLAAVDAKLKGQALETAGVAQVDVIKLFEGKTIPEICQIGKIYVGRLSTRFGVPIYADVYGTRGYPGDSWTASGQQGAGNIIPLG